MSPARPFIKVCCIASVDEASRAIAAGASALGLVSAMPSGPGPIPDELIADIAARIQPPTRSFLLTARTLADAIAEQHRQAGTTTLQLVDQVPAGELRRLRRLLPGTEIVQVIHVQDEASIGEAREVAGLVDGILLDSGRPGLAVKELGGTGRVHDWALSRRIREAVTVPVLLAGGLNADNAAAALRAVAPAGLDACSGLRSEGQLDENKLRAFMAAAGLG